MAKGKKTCPHCGSNEYATLKSSPGGRVTRCCSQGVVGVAGLWYASHEDAPEWRVMDKAARGMDAPLAFGDRTYQAWLRGAKTLLERCNGAIDLALRVLDTFFTSDEWKWHASVCSSIYFILNNSVFWRLLKSTHEREREERVGADVQARHAAAVPQAALVEAYATGGI